MRKNNFSPRTRGAFLSQPTPLTPHHTTFRPRLASPLLPPLSLLRRPNAPRTPTPLSHPNASLAPPHPPFHRYISHALSATLPPVELCFFSPSHLILPPPHPSPLSCRFFSRTTTTLPLTPPLKPQHLSRAPTPLARPNISPNKHPLLRTTSPTPLPNHLSAYPRANHSLPTFQHTPHFLLPHHSFRPDIM